MKNRTAEVRHVNGHQINKPATEPQSWFNSIPPIKDGTVTATLEITLPPIMWGFAVAIAMQTGKSVGEVVSVALRHGIDLTEMSNELENPEKLKELGL